MRRMREEPRGSKPPGARPSDFLLRRMTHDDLPAVMELEKASFTNPWSLELLRRELGHDWSVIFLLEEPTEEGGRRLLGISIFWIVHDEVHVLNVATTPEHRRRGVGRALMEATLAEGRARKCSLATLEVRKSNEAAINLYKSFGFRPVGVRPNYYVDEGQAAEDAIVMVLDF
ncbi:Ribosomal-protein-S18p-alanine acetyltransferase [Cystobacter fuscus DSM 2262]|uniref:Ribosomal-protein-S18p-alanine acetyltransferase n=1 Tax=Cystobacter fuscus (strain ATCC 25194 / DSM 2262 / NBRC 100088 / M29) TaxID=1242864 RepID=S9NT56_CYSF2|nr:ribosomal protein S18-alanine N-acetyltransferase [Cystobacter fuscus]EPX55305.1 Ribosomal-protein-S18p-alanine acetyltransferase [Cystobacter fuscus DSM 2262]